MKILFLFQYLGGLASYANIISRFKSTGYIKIIHLFTTSRDLMAADDDDMNCPFSHGPDYQFAIIISLSDMPLNATYENFLAIIPDTF
jgi:hypothetical protein